MLHRVTVVLATGLILVLSAGLAEAKIGPLMRVDITGPGLTGPLTLTGSQGEELMGQTDLLGENYDLSTVPPVGKANLGPAYFATFRFRTLNEHTGRVTDGVTAIEQTIYPYAKRGATAFVPGGQVMGHDGSGDFTIPEHWSASLPALRSNAESYGFPPAPEKNETRTSEVPREPRGSRSWLWVMLLPAGAGVAFGSTLVRRRRNGV